MADITQHNERSGRLILEDSSVLNEGDALNSVASFASRLPNFYRAFWFGTIPSLTTAYFQILIPSGYNIWGFNRISTVRLDRLNSTFVVGGTPGTVQSTETGYRFDERNGGGTAQSVLRKVTTLTGSSARTPPIPIIPGTAPTRSPAAQTEAGLQPAFDSSSLPGFIYENPTGGDAELYLQVTWQEVSV